MGIGAAMWHAQRTQFFFLRIARHSIVEGLGVFSNLDHIRVLLRPSTTMQNLWQLDCNSGNSWYGHFSEPLLSESAFVYEGLPQNYLLGAADLSPCRTWSSDSYRDMRCVRVASCAKRVVNLFSACTEQAIKQTWAELWVPSSLGKANKNVPPKPCRTRHDWNHPQTTASLYEAVRGCNLKRWISIVDSLVYKTAGKVGAYTTSCSLARDFEHSPEDKVPLIKRWNASAFLLSVCLLFFL